MALACGLATFAVKNQVKVKVLAFREPLNFAVLALLLAVQIEALVAAAVWVCHKPLVATILFGIAGSIVLVLALPAEA